MRNFNPEVHRANISKVEYIPESEWIMVQRKVKSSLNKFIPCNKHACNSKSHTIDRCRWINPELRPNIKISNVPNIGSEIESSNRHLPKLTTNQVNDHRSCMQSHYDFIMCKLSQESNSEIRILFKKYLKGISASLLTIKDGDQDKISRIFNITILYLKYILRLIKIIQDNPTQDTGQYHDPEPRPELRPNEAGKLCIRSQDELQKHIEYKSQPISNNRNIEIVSNNNDLEKLDVYNTNTSILKNN